MPEQAISSSAGDGTQRRRGRPRKHASDAARKLDWYHRQRKTGETLIQDVPPVVHEVLYCGHCCRRQTVALEASGYRCSVCRREVQPPGDPEACPRSPDGQHNAYSTPAGWICSQCNATVPEPADYGLMRLGRQP
jgi:hypothetical protein